MTSTKQLIYVCQRIALLQRDKVTILFTTVMDLSLGEEHYGVESDAFGAAPKFSPNKLRAQQCYAAI